MKAYRTKTKALPGTDFREVRKKAFDLYQEIKRKTKRRAYIRSAYFKKDKIFIDLFWQHLFEKRIGEIELEGSDIFQQRLKLYATVDLILHLRKIETNEVRCCIDLQG